MHDDKVYGNIAPAYSFAAQAVEVEVDTETGQVTVVDSYVADDCGKALNPLAIHGQTNGATVQAIGWTLYEQLQLEGGRYGNGNFADYTMPTADAVPHAARRHRRIERSQRPLRRQGRQRDAPSCPARRPSPTRCTTPSACASPNCRSRPKRSWPRCATRKEETRHA